MWPADIDALKPWWRWITVGITTGMGVILIRRWVAGNVCRSTASMKGRTVIITGANTGIGKATALEMAKRDARVIMACRDLSKAEHAVEDIRKCTQSGQLVVSKLDLASLQSVREFAAKVCREEVCIHVLINNAGVYQCPYALTEDGLEMNMAVNHFGHFLLVHLLLNKLKASVPSRVVIVSSGLHKFGRIDFDNLDGRQQYVKTEVYRNSKLANNLFARELARRTSGSGVSVYCLRPGMVRTELGRHVPMGAVLRFISWPLAWLLVKSPYEGCQTVLHCAVSEEVSNDTGRFYANCAEEPWSEVSLDDSTARRLWTISEQLTGIDSTKT